MKKFSEILDEMLAEKDLEEYAPVLPQHHLTDAQNYAIISDMDNEEYAYWVNAGRPPFFRFVTLELDRAGRFRF